MISRRVIHDDEREMFLSLSHRVYDSDPYWDSSSEDCALMLLNRQSAFSSRADICPWLFYHHSEIEQPAARCILVRDHYAPKRCLVACFEALPSVKKVSGSDSILQSIRETVSLSFPDISINEIIYGLNGHLNHGAGYLIKPFDCPPLYDTPYTQSWYHELFSDLNRILLESYEFSLLESYTYTSSLQIVLQSRFKNKYSSQENMIPVIRLYDKSHMDEELSLYTRLNNICFEQHPFWTPRREAEDRELFQTMFSSLNSRHLLFAERGGKPAGFLAWFPDYNCISGNRCRLYEIAVTPEERNSEVLPLLFCSFVQYAVEEGFTECEGGFILQTNTASTATARRYIDRVLRFTHGNSDSRKIKPYRLLALYEEKLT